MFCDVTSFYYEPIKKFIRLATSICQWSSNILVNIIRFHSTTVKKRRIVENTVKCKCFLYSYYHLIYSNHCIEITYIIRNKGDPYRCKQNKDRSGGTLPIFNLIKINTMNKINISYKKSKLIPPCVEIIVNNSPKLSSDPIICTRLGFHKSCQTDLRNSFNHRVMIDSAMQLISQKEITFYLILKTIKMKKIIIKKEKLERIPIEKFPNKIVYEGIKLKLYTRVDNLVFYEAIRKVNKPSFLIGRTFKHKIKNKNDEYLYIELLVNAVNEETLWIYTDYDMACEKFNMIYKEIG